MQRLAAPEHTASQNRGSSARSIMYLDSGSVTATLQGLKAQTGPASGDATGSVVAWGVLPERPLAKIIRSQPSPRPPVSKDLRGSPDRRPYDPGADTPSATRQKNWNTFLALSLLARNIDLVDRDEHRKKAIPAATVDVATTIVSICAVVDNNKKEVAVKSKKPVVF
ncbi:hypothetical protein FDECE_9673 [Fusarium decemcellulare]|nr:hypothetical protein FDECE_9673 [Fusarium decemcellulare]